MTIPFTCSTCAWLTSAVLADEQSQANGEPVSKPHKPADDQLHKSRTVHNNLVTNYLPNRKIKSGKLFLMYFSMNLVIKV